MSKWKEFIESIKFAENELNCKDTFYRGHSDSSWKLESTLARQLSGLANPQNKEAKLFSDFRTKGAHLLPPTIYSEWEVLFYMQHHGVPTRLLDWTTSFGIALYFALKNPSESIAVWVLNPYALNKESINFDILMDAVHAESKKYVDYKNNSLSNSETVALLGTSSVGRMHAQDGVFTVQGDLNVPLDVEHEGCFRKIVLEKEGYPDAREFLSLAGINEYSIFPDLDGLARTLVQREFGTSE